MYNVIGYPGNGVARIEKGEYSRSEAVTLAKCLTDDGTYDKAEVYNLESGRLSSVVAGGQVYHYVQYNNIDDVTALIKRLAISLSTNSKLGIKYSNQTGIGYYSSSAEIEVAGKEGKLTINRETRRNSHKEYSFSDVSAKTVSLLFWLTDTLTRIMEVEVCRVIIEDIDRIILTSVSPQVFFTMSRGVGNMLTVVVTYRFL